MKNLFDPKRKTPLFYKVFILITLNLLCLITFILLCLPSLICAGDITLQWDKVSSPRVVGYNLWWSEASLCPTGVNSCSNPEGAYTHQQYVTIEQDEEPQANNTHTITLRDLNPCIPWCFAVTSVDAQGVHSDYSNQIGLPYVLNNISGSTESTESN